MTNSLGELHGLVGSVSVVGLVGSTVVVEGLAAAEEQAQVVSS